MFNHGIETYFYKDYVRERNLQIPRPLLTLCNPFLQHRPIPRLKAHLERLWLRRQRRRNRIALDGVQNRMVRSILRRVHREGHDEPHVRRVQLAVGQVRAGAHARAGAVAVVGGAGAFAQVEVAFGEELEGVLEVVFVVVGGPGVLHFISHLCSKSCWGGGERGHTMKKVVPAGM